MPSHLVRLIYPVKITGYIRTTVKSIILGAKKAIENHIVLRCFVKPLKFNTACFNLPTCLSRLYSLSKESVSGAWKIKLHSPGEIPYLLDTPSSYSATALPP
jgi:hypothetical protein